jgi:hypothetical protein
MASPLFWRLFLTAFVLSVIGGAVGWIGILYFHLSVWWMLVPVLVVESAYMWFHPQRAR